MAEANKGTATQLIETKTLTAEEFESKYIPILNAVAELVISHPEIPEDMDQSDLLGSITLLTSEMRNELTGRVPEIVALQDKIAKQAKQIVKLQDTNQILFLKQGNYRDPNELEEPVKPQKKSFDDIKRMIESL